MGVREQPKGKNMAPTTSTTTARDELAQLVMMIAVHPDLLDYRHNDYSSGAVCLGDARRIADKALAAGYRKSRTICYVILDGDASPQARYATKAEAEEVRDSWIAAHESAGVPHKFRMAEIVESA